MKPLFLDRFDKVVDGVPIDVLMAFVAVNELDGLTISEPIEREIETRLSPDELVLLARAHEAERLAGEIANSREFTSLRQRLGARSSITVLGFDSRGAQAGRHEVVKGELTSAVGIDEIVRRGVTSIFRERGGFVESTASYHFLNPSGRHTSRFIRLSNLLVHHCEISFIALSILGGLPVDASNVYVVTPSLFAVVAAANQHRRALAPKLPELVADSFMSYEEVDTFEFTDIANATAIISASSSGSLATRVEARGLDAARIFHVLFLGKTVAGVRFAVDLSGDTDGNPEGLTSERSTYATGMCKLCDQGSTAIPLRGDQFDIAPPQPKALTIKVTHAPKGLSATMARLVDGACFQVYASTGSQIRVDQAALLAAKPFDDRLSYVVHREIPPISHILLASEQSRPLAERIAAIAAIAGVSATIHADVNALDAAGGLESGAALLVVSAVTGTGRVLLEISRDLRTVWHDRPIIYLAGFARTESEAAIDALRRDLEMTKCPVPHPLVIVDRIALPGADLSNSWSNELTFLNRFGGAGLSVELAARRDRLRESSNPMVDDLLVSNTPSRPLKLRPGFAFWPDALFARANTRSQSDVFATIAAVLQHLRNVEMGEGEALVTNWFQQTLLAPKNFGRYNDGIIQACLLRAARPTELDFASDATLSREAGRIVRLIVAEPNRDRGEAAAEFLIALGCGRLRLKSDDLESVLKPTSDAPPLVAEPRLLTIKATG